MLPNKLPHGCIKKLLTYSTVKRLSVGWKGREDGQMYNLQFWYQTYETFFALIFLIRVMTYYKLLKRRIHPYITFIRGSLSSYVMEISVRQIIELLRKYTQYTTRV